MLGASRLSYLALPQVEGIVTGTGLYGVDNQNNGYINIQSFWDQASGTAVGGLTVSFWVKLDASMSGEKFIFEEYSGSTGIPLRISLDNNWIAISSFNTSISRFLLIGYNRDASKFGADLSFGSWAHVMCAYDPTNYSGNPPVMYVNGVSVTAHQSPGSNWTTQNGNNSAGLWARYGGGVKSDCHLSDFWMDDQYIDLTNSTNRAKFYNSGSPVDLGSDGSTPTGSQPLNFFSGPASNWSTNLGTNTKTVSVQGTLYDSDGPAV